MSILRIFIVGLGVFVSLYYFWNRLKEDYTSNKIFTSFFYSFLGSLFFYLICIFFLVKFLGSGFSASGVLFWLSFFGGVVGLVVGIVSLKLKSIETIEAAGVGFLYLMVSIFVADAFTSLSLISLATAVVVALCIVLFYFLETKYKNLSWYKSGRVGFSGLFSLGVFFLVRSLVAIAFPYVLSFLGKYEPMIASTTAFLLFLGIFNLSRQK